MDGWMDGHGWMDGWTWMNGEGGGGGGGGVSFEFYLLHLLLHFALLRVL